MAQTTAEERDVQDAATPDARHNPNTFVWLMPMGPMQVTKRDERGHTLARYFGVPQDSLSAAELEAEADFDHRNADVKRTSGVAPDTAVAIYLSHVGFSHDHRTALVYVRYHCGALCGEADFEFLTRDTANVWRITHEYRESVE